jgi:hypothetical protein
LADSIFAVIAAAGSSGSNWVTPVPLSWVFEPSGIPGRASFHQFSGLTCSMLIAFVWGGGLPGIL